MNEKASASDPTNDLRRQAENATQVESIVVPENQDALSPEESRRLLHELRVHQIELEMQNDELRRAHAELDTSRARYFDMFDLAPMGYFTLSGKGLIMEANFAATTLLGVAKGILARQPLSRFILPEYQDIYYRHRKKLFETGIPQTCELRMLRADNTPFWAQLDAFATNGAEGAAACRAVIIDITERKQLEDAQLFLLQCSSRDSDDDFFKSLARYLAQSLRMDYVCIDRLEGEGLSARTVAIYFDGKFEGNVTYTLKDTPCGDVVGRTVCCFDRDVRHLFPRDGVLQEMKAESYVGATLWSFDGKPIGLIAIISRRPLANPRLAESMLKMASVRAAGELERLQAIEALRENEIKLQKAHDALEDRVKERTRALTLSNKQLLKEIQERVQTENALKESEERYRSIFHNNHANMLLTDPETSDIIDANPAACAFYGYSCEELTTKKLTDINIISPDILSKRFAQALSNRQNHFFSSHRLSSGRVREVEAFVGTVRIKDKPLLFSVIHDITERRQAESALRESEKRFRLLTETIEDVFWISTPGAGELLYVSPAYEKIWMNSIESLYRSPGSFTEAIHPEDRGRVFAERENHASTAWNYEYRIVRPDGTMRWVQDRGFPIRDDTGKLQLMTGVATDITERRQVEQRMVEVSEFVQKIFDASPLGIAAYDTSGQCVMANEAVGRIIGASREAVLQQNLNHLDSWKRSGLLTAAREVIQTNQTRENLEFRFVSTFGKDITLHCSLIPFSSSNKPHLLMIGQDISRQKQADEALRQSQKLASIGLLVAGIAHEINNPNGFIIFNLPILKDYLQELMPIVDDYMGDHPNRSVFGRLYEDFRKDLFKLLDNIEHGAQRINSTVSGLINFSRNREKLELRQVAMKQVIDHAVSMCRREIRENVKSLHLVIPENLPPVRTDPEAVEQILVNLLINAAHASNKEDSWIRLCVSAGSDKPDRCVIVIEDNGCGMDEKTMKRIFDPFYTRKTSVQGTGLGLYICQSLAEGLGGRIEVESRPDQGCSFRVILNDLL